MTPIEWWLKSGCLRDGAGQMVLWVFLLVSY
jgi:hypothetical protein